MLVKRWSNRHRRDTAVAVITRADRMQTIVRSGPSGVWAPARRDEAGDQWRRSVEAVRSDETAPDAGTAVLSAARTLSAISALSAAPAVTCRGNNPETSGRARSHGARRRACRRCRVQLATPILNRFPGSGLASSVSRPNTLPVGVPARVLVKLNSPGLLLTGLPSRPFHPADLAAQPMQRNEGSCCCLQVATQ
jgi:hypothetical protein